MKVYSDPKGRPNKWRVKLPNGSYKTITAASETQAVFAAESAIAQFEAPPGEWLELVNRHIYRREAGSPGLADKTKWQGSRYVLRRFANTFESNCKPSTVTMTHFLDYWDGLTRHQQDNLRPELNRFIKWCMLAQLIVLPANPIGLLDKKALPKKKRQRLTRGMFDGLLRVAADRGYDGLIQACRLSLLTTLRRGDLAQLRWDDIKDGALYVTVSKSIASRGEVQAARLRWDLQKHPDLLLELKECRRQAMMNRDCPFVISHFGANRIGKTKQHACQMTPDMISKQFTECMREVVRTDDHPTFHEIRSLAAANLENMGAPGETISKIMAHTDESTTELYLVGHDRKFFDVDYSVTV